LGVRALRAQTRTTPGSVRPLESSARFQGNIFDFGPPKAKMRSRFPAVLPGFPPSCSLDSDSETEGGHGSFCDWGCGLAAYAVEGVGLD
jgi:hypothetical protein